MELLAPAGSFETLKAAVQSGADAVYIGGSEFSARRSAVNFTLEEVDAAAKYCRLRDVKLHVAANILIKEKETEAFLEYIGKLNDIGVDAVIIQDIGMAMVVRQMYPDLPLHASTQLTVTNLESALMLKDAGFSRVVLARELSRDAIEKITKESGVETEVFAHGALCMSYSGQCLMSSIIGGRSGNRGMCAQPCRLPYTIGDKKGHLLSPKDLCMVEHLKELKETGVASIKIEGRLKRSEYASAVCRVYRKYLDTDAKVSKTDMQELYDAFSRSGFTDKYYLGTSGKSMMCYENPANAAENIFSEDVKKRCGENANFKKTEIFISAELRKNMPLTVSVWNIDGIFVTKTGEVEAEEARSVALSEERLKTQLLKLGDTPFYANDAEVILDQGIALPISEINNVRRLAMEDFTREKEKAPVRCKLDRKIKDYSFENKDITLVCEVWTEEQAQACVENGITTIYADTPLANRLRQKYKNTEIVAKLPPIFRDDRVYEKPQTDTVLISNMGQSNCGKKCIGGLRLNIFNSESADFYKDLERVTLSPELNLKELSCITAKGEIIGYGRIPLMALENCPLRALGKCQKNKNNEILEDRLHEKFPLKCNEGCVLEVINSKPIYLADKPEFVNNLKIHAIRLIFTVENFEECGKIIGEYKKTLNGNIGSTPKENTFTRGHYFRGVE